jgi:hypothetical protein
MMWRGLRRHQKALGNAWLWLDAPMEKITPVRVEASCLLRLQSLNKLDPSTPKRKDGNLEVCLFSILISSVLHLQ